VKPRPSTVLDTVLDSVLRTALLFSLFLLFVGHNAPGGGFVGGLTAGAALVLRYAAEGSEGVDRLVPYPEGLFLGGGVVIATLDGLAGYVWGDAFLASAKVEFSVGVLGTFKATTALPFDIGVYLVVVGLVLAILRALGGDDPTTAVAPDDAAAPGASLAPGGDR
jgi:multicomponent Na+:H+ antiporter subunit A